MHFLVAFFIFSLLQISNAKSFDVPKALTDFGQEGNPGLQVCMRRNIRAAFSGVFGKIIDTEIPKIRPRDTTVKLATVNHGALTLRNLRFASYSKAEKHQMNFASSNEIEWISTGSGFNLTGNFGGSFQQMFTGAVTSGAVECTAANANVTVRLRVHSQPKTRKLRFEMTHCDAKFARAKVHIKSSGFLGALSKFVQTALAQSESSVARDLICGVARFMVDEILNHIDFSDTIVLDKSGGSQEGFASQVRFPPELLLDYSLLRDLRVYNNCVSIQMDGRSSWQDEPIEETPFSPPRLNYSTKINGSHMADVWISDFVVNSVLYQLNARNHFDFTLSEKSTPQLKTLLQTHCLNSTSSPPAARPVRANRLQPSKDADKGQNRPSTACIGGALPELANSVKYPKQTVEIQWKPSDAAVAPYVLFEDENAKLTAEALLDLTVKNDKGKRETLLTAVATIVCHLQNVSMDKELKFFTAKLVDTNATLKLLRNRLLAPPASSIEARLDSFETLLSKIVHTAWSSKFEKGAFPAPKFDGFKLSRKPDVALFHRTMNLAAFVDVDLAFWLNAVDEARIRAQGK